MRNDETINERLFRLLAERGITQAQLAKGTGINPRAISDWHNKGTNPNADKVAVISSYLGVSTDWLLTGSDDLPSNMVSVRGRVSGNAIVQGMNNGIAIGQSGRGQIVSDSGTQSRSPEEKELLRIFQKLDVRNRMKLLQTAYELEETDGKT